MRKFLIKEVSKHEMADWNRPYEKHIITEDELKRRINKIVLESGSHGIDRDIKILIAPPPVEKELVIKYTLRKY